MCIREPCTTTRHVYLCANLFAIQAQTDTRAHALIIYLTACHGSLHHVVRLALLPRDLLYPFGRVWVDLWHHDLRFFPGLLRHGFYKSTAQAQQNQLRPDGYGRRLL